MVYLFFNFSKNFHRYYFKVAFSNVAPSSTAAATAAATSTTTAEQEQVESSQPPVKRSKPDRPAIKVHTKKTTLQKKLMKL